MSHMINLVPPLNLVEIVFAPPLICIDFVHFRGVYSYMFDYWLFEIALQLFIILAAC